RRRHTRWPRDWSSDVCSSDLASGIRREGEPEDVPGLTSRIRQAAAAGIAQVLIMGSSKGNDAKLWVKNFKTLGPIARDHGVMIRSEERRVGKECRSRWTQKR